MRPTCLTSPFGGARSGSAPIGVALFGAIASFASLGCSRPTSHDSTRESGSISVSVAPLSAPAPTARATAERDADVLTHASPVYDAAANGPTLGADVVDGAALIARHEKALGTKAPVTILRGGSPAALGERLCEAVVPNRPSAPVLLKPNIGGFDWFKDPKTHHGDDGLKGRITDPEFVRGVIRCLKKRGHTKITVVEGWGSTHKEWTHLMSASGYDAMTREENVPLLAMDDDGVFDVEGETPGKPLRISGIEKTEVPSLLIAKILAEHEVDARGIFISLPKVKAHRFGVFSIAIKGMQGTVMTSDAAPAFRQKWRMHKELVPYLNAAKGLDDRQAYVAALERFAARIADVLAIESPDVVLAEGAPAMGGDGFEKMYPLKESFAIGGTNPIWVDRVGAELLGLWDNAALARELGGHPTSPLLEAAAKRFDVDLSEAPIVVGDGASLLATQHPVHYVAMAPFSIHSDGSGPTIPSVLERDDGGDGAVAERPEVHAVHLAADDGIVIDGRGDDAVWSRAKATHFVTDFAGNATPIGTDVRFAWSAKALYVLFDLASAGLNTDRTQPTAVDRARLYREDCVEMFLAPDPNERNRYYEIELGPYGHFLDIDVDHAAKTSDVGWSSEPRIEATQNAAARTATIEAEFLSTAIARALAKDARLPLGLYRLEGKPQVYLAWSPPRTARPNFHVPEAFGTLVLDP